MDSPHKGGIPKLSCRIGKGASEADEPTAEVLSPLSRMFVQKLRDDDQDLVIHILLGLGSLPGQGNFSTSGLRSLLEEHVITAPRFSSLMVTSRRKVGPFILGEEAAWVPVAVNLDNHIREVDISPIATTHQTNSGENTHSANTSREDLVLRYVETQCAIPLRRDIPLWEVQIISHPPVMVPQKSSQSAVTCTQTLLWRVHHALGDGIALGTILAKGARTAAGEVPKNWIPIPKSRPRRRSWLHAALWRFQYLINSILSLWKLILLILLAPDPIVGVKSPSADIRHKPRDLSRFTIPLEEAKAVASSCGGTINDVLLCVLAAAIHWSIPEEDSRKMHRLPRTLCMSSIRGLRGLSKNGKVPDSLADLEVPMGTKVGFFAVDLPLVLERRDEELRKGGMGIRDALTKIQSDTAAIKHSFEGWFMNFFLRLTSWACGPLAMYKLVVFVISKVTAALSNLPGPLEELYLCGTPVLSVYQFLAGAPIGASLHCVSYHGAIHCTITTDPERVHGGTLRKRTLAAWGAAKEECSTS